MLAQERRAPTWDLSDWIGPMSPAFAATLAADATPDGSPVPPGGAGEASGDHPAPAVRRPTETIGASSSAPVASVVADASVDELRTLFHTLNNQLGVVITYAELLEAKLPDDGLRKRATQVLTAALDALGTTRQIRQAVVR
jgi:hypothetical protein